MTLTIELPDDLQAALRAQANAQGVSEAGYVRTVLERELAVPSEAGSHPFKTGAGSLAKYGPGPSEEEIDENRADMFRRFAEDF
jgi:plasmid stability protein